MERQRQAELEGGRPAARRAEEVVGRHRPVDQANLGGPSQPGVVEQLEIRSVIREEDPASTRRGEQLLLIAGPLYIEVAGGHDLMALRPEENDNLVAEILIGVEIGHEMLGGVCC